MNNDRVANMKWIVETEAESMTIWMLQANSAFWTFKPKLFTTEDKARKEYEDFIQYLKRNDHHMFDDDGDPRDGYEERTAENGGEHYVLCWHDGEVDIDISYEAVEVL